MVSRVFMICDAYESGYGHGLKEDGKDLSETPHSDPELGEAYQTGYEAGEERAEEARTWRDERIAELEEKVRLYSICMNTGGIDDLHRDAARYRWLRQPDTDLDALAAANWKDGEVYSDEQFDAAIDAAMK